MIESFLIGPNAGAGFLYKMKEDSQEIKGEKNFFEIGISI